MISFLSLKILLNKT